MKVTLTEKLNLDIYKLPFELRFEFNRKRGVDNDYWFTPSGKCKIWIGACNLEHLGTLDEGQYDMLMTAMKKAKCDVLSDGSDYYTTGDNTIIRILNLTYILGQAKKEWEARKYIDFWVKDDRPMVDDSYSERMRIEARDWDYGMGEKHDNY